MLVLSRAPGTRRQPAQVGWADKRKAVGVLEKAPQSEEFWDLRIGGGSFPPPGGAPCHGQPEGAWTLGSLSSRDFVLRVSFSSHPHLGTPPIESSPFLGQGTHCVAYDPSKGGLSGAWPASCSVTACRDLGIALGSRVSSNSPICSQFLSSEQF